MWMTSLVLRDDKDVPFSYGLCSFMAAYSWTDFSLLEEIASSKAQPSHFLQGTIRYPVFCLVFDISSIALHSGRSHDGLLLRSSPAWTPSFPSTIWVLRWPHPGKCWAAKHLCRWRTLCGCTSLFGTRSWRSYEGFSAPCADQSGYQNARPLLYRRFDRTELQSMTTIFCITVGFPTEATKWLPKLTIAASSL